jgi:hypothetical protein
VRVVSVALLLVCAAPSTLTAQPTTGARCLVGHWRVTLTLDSSIIDTSASGTPATIPGHPAEGTIHFPPEYADSLTPTELGDSSRSSWGTFAIDFVPLWGQYLIPQPSTGWPGGEPSPLTEAAAIQRGDTALIILMPRISHGSIGLAVEDCPIAASVLEGPWVVLSGRSWATGHYTLRRDQ